MADVAENGPNEPIPAVKDLASSEASIRRNSLQTIIRHLNDRSPTSPLSKTQCLQLWRGFYVAVYMHDSKSAISVQNLITEVAGLLKVIAAKDAEIPSSDAQSRTWLSTWTTAFWDTICREWASIDQWRMNKVLLLVRVFLRETFQVALTAVSDDISEDRSDSANLVTEQVQILESSPLSPRVRKVPDGLRLHVLDIWSEELSAQVKIAQNRLESSEDDDQNHSEETLLDSASIFMTAVERLKKEALSKGVRMRAKEALDTYQESLNS